MKQILFSVTMLVVLGTAACGNRDNTTEGADRSERMPDNTYDSPIDTSATSTKDSIDSLIPPTPIMP
ncbi:hypothetical protein [Sphingobacterium paucimobilis]|uniref:Uncharacterized protein n=1 Tax=Sphingobacterium paucimobilis HER1398 TaxID=1346330 RepID=U2HPB0_9SPHI|nr:hypothetical protein [Sphingobacterium paucimobilis]ERJ57307.1 hypothetical protein M472_00865 [Sphingobacterium paucimobilis HER1398]